jgi:hypothetical protein
MEQEEALTDRSRQAGILALLALSATCLALAPLALPPSYSWILHTTSEAAAQRVAGAWVTRSGFLLFGFAVLWLTSFAGRRWGRWGALLLGTFGVMMLMTAAFSHRPWVPDAPFDHFEDLLHSVTATSMGFAFAAGVVAVGVGRSDASRLDRSGDTLAVIASVVIPMAMSQGTALTGALQRLMFLVAYIWYAREVCHGAL